MSARACQIFVAGAAVGVYGRVVPADYAPSQTVVVDNVARDDMTPNGRAFAQRNAGNDLTRT
jgi:hypothetical protein